MPAEQNETTLRRWAAECWNQGNLAVTGELVADDFICYQPAGLPELRGRAAHDQWIGGSRAAFPDFRVTYDDLFADATGEKLTGRWTVRATHTGPLPTQNFGTLAPTGNPVVFTGIHIYRMAHGKIAEMWNEYDVLGLLQQLGALPRQPQTTS